MSNFTTDLFREAWYEHFLNEGYTEEESEQKVRELEEKMSD